MGFRHIVFCLTMLVFSLFTRAQEIPGKVMPAGQVMDWREFVSTLSGEMDVHLFFDPAAIPDSPVRVRFANMSVEAILKEHFSGTGIQVSTDGQGNYFLYPDFRLRPLPEAFFDTKKDSSKTSEISPALQLENVRSDEFLKSYTSYISENVTIGTQGAGQNGRVSLNGIVTSEKDKTPIPAATLKIEELERYVTTDNAGRYEFSLTPGQYTVSVSSMGFVGKAIKVDLLSGGRLDISLLTKSILLDETVIMANRNHNVESTHMGLDNISAAAIKKIPVMLGEQDVVKVALLLPGVQSVGEASAGFNVRGSPADQNIFYVNGVPVFNATHLFGLFTTFNPDAVNGFDLYKSNIPVEYGGRLSSIFNIEAKKGNLQDFSARGGISPVSGRVMLEGPLKKDKGSFLASFRTTYSDWLLKQTNNIDISNSEASFYDALMNFSYQLDPKNSLGFFLYASNDYSDIAFGVRSRYSNLGSSLKWNHTFNPKLAMDLDLVTGNFQFEEENYEISYLANQHSFDLLHNELKLTMQFKPDNKHTLKAGVNFELTGLDHGDLRPLSDESNIKPISFQSERGLVSSVFAGDQWDVNEKLSVEAGVRGTLYTLLGPGTVYEYMENSPVEIRNMADSTSYGRNKVISSYQNLDLRFAARYSFTPDFSLKLSYNTLHQYLFMLSNTISVSPTNKWKLSDPHLKPMAGKQYSAGLYKNLWQDRLEVSVETYYKEVQNLLEYKDGADFLTNQYPETNIIQGELEAYGAEFFLKKKTGRFNGWVNYTWSHAEVKAVNEATGERNNRGRPYPANYDRPHAVNAVMNFNVSKRFNVSANAVYSTGRPITFPTAIYYQNGIEVIAFSNRNEYRMPDYFRTDLSLNFEGNLRREKLAHGSWSISLYNITARKNPYTTIFRNEDGKIKGYEISILGTMIPSISYNLKFGNYDN